MKQQSEDRSIETSGGLASNTFAIKTSPQAFQLLSSGLYTNKIQAVLRELGCNAVDAHQQAGCPERPIEVKLPNALDKQFYVKDYGTGLNHNQIMRLYTTYFDSTKQDSNDFIGGFGVGSKSPFAYTDSFTVESRFNGEKRLYSAYVNEDGIPTIMQLSEEKTDEPNGLTIGFPVKPDDFQEFIREAVQTYKWFKVPPEIKGNILKIENIKGLDLGKLWAVKYISNNNNYNSYNRNNNNSSSIRMGSVAYPIGALFSNIDTTNESNEVKECIAAARTLLEHNDNWVIDLPIGSSLVAASREALQFDKKSIASLQKALVPVIQEAVLNIHNIVSKNVTNIRDYYKNIQELVSSNSNMLNKYNPLFTMLQAHNPNYHPDGIKVNLNDYPALNILNMSTRHLEDFYSKTKRKVPAIDADEVQRRIRRKIAASYNQDGKEADYTNLSQMIWNMNDDTIKTWAFPESEDIQEIIDLTLANCNSNIENDYVIIPAPNATEKAFKDDMKKLCTYLNIKTSELVRPVKPPKKKIIKTEDIYGILVEKGQRSSDLSKLAKQRMMTSTLTSIIEPDSEYTYVVFDKKAFPHSKDDSNSQYHTALTFSNNIRKLKGHALIKDQISDYLPEDGVIMIEKTDIPVFRQICPDSKPLDAVIAKIKHDTKIAKTLQKAADALPENVSYTHNASNWIRFYNACKEYAERNKLDISQTVLYKTVSVWVQKQELSDNTSNDRMNIKSSAELGTSYFNWPSVKIVTPANTNPEIEMLNDLYPLLSMISYYNDKYDKITNYILEQDELRFYRTNISHSMSI